jgi:hypothetical protein
MADGKLELHDPFGRHAVRHLLDHVRRAEARQLVRHAAAVLVPSQQTGDVVERHVEAGELDAAREINARILPLARLDMTPKLVQYFKAAQDAVGFTGGPTRAPRLPLKADEVAALEAALAILREPAVAEPLEAGGYTVAGGTPEDYAAFQRAEIARWRRVAQAANIVLD